MKRVWRFKGSSWKLEVYLEGTILGLLDGNVKAHLENSKKLHLVKNLHEVSKVATEAKVPNKLYKALKRVENRAKSNRKM